MREILFRGKGVDNGEWEYGDFSSPQNIVWLDKGFDKALQREEEIVFDEPVIPETVGQYTGLTDKNGKKIFEGDILKWTDHQTKGRHVQGAVVLWAFGWKVKNIFNGDYENWSWSNNTHEVIGNIHDNPELLEES